MLSWNCILVACTLEEYLVHQVWRTRPLVSVLLGAKVHECMSSKLTCRAMEHMLARFRTSLRAIFGERSLFRSTLYEEDTVRFVGKVQLAQTLGNHGLWQQSSSQPYPSMFLPSRPQSNLRSLSYTCFRQIRPSHKPPSHQAPYLSLKETVSKSQRRKHLRPGVNSDARLVIRDRRIKRNLQKRLLLGREPFFRKIRIVIFYPNSMLHSLSVFSLLPFNVLDI